MGKSQPNTEAFEAVAHFQRGGFLFHFAPALCNRLFTGMFTLLLRCIAAFPLALHYLLHFHGPWWTEVLQVELSQPVSLNQQVLAGEGVLTLIKCLAT